MRMYWIQGMFDVLAVVVRSLFDPKGTSKYVK